MIPITGPLPATKENRKWIAKEVERLEKKYDCLVKDGQTKQGYPTIMLFRSEEPKSENTD